MTFIPGYVSGLHGHRIPSAFRPNIKLTGGDSHDELKGLKLFIADR
jgi:hypothetical protein